MKRKKKKKKKRLVSVASQVFEIPSNNETCMFHARLTLRACASHGFMAISTFGPIVT